MLVSLRNTFILFNFVFFTLFSYSTILNAKNIIYGGFNKSFGKLKIEGVEKYKDIEKKTEILRLSKVNFKNSKNLVYVNFNQNKTPSQLREQTGQFNVTKANYYTFHDPENGLTFAHFNDNEHGVFLERIKFYKNQDILSNYNYSKPHKDFSIDLRFLPDFLLEKNVILQKTFYSSSKIKSLEILIINNKLKIIFKNLFVDSNGVMHDITLESLEKISNNWQHVLISYQSSNSKLSLFINGKIQETVYAKSEDNIWGLYFETYDNSPLKLASKFIGKFDYFRIVSDVLNPESAEININNYPKVIIDYDNKKVFNKKGKVYSDLLFINKKLVTKYAKLKIKTSMPEGTAIDFFVRTSLQPFSINQKDVNKSDQDLIQNSFQKKENEENEENVKNEIVWKRVGESGIELRKFRYFQWMAILRSDSLGLHTPSIDAIEINYLKIPKLSAPRNLKIENVYFINNSPNINLVWEHEINPNENQAYYTVYYGFKKNEYLGKILYHYYRGNLGNLKKINEQVSLENENFNQNLKYNKQNTKNNFYQKIEINNNTIRANLSKDNQKILPLLEPGQTLYFTVTASDNENESDYSNSIIVNIPDEP